MDYPNNNTFQVMVLSEFFIEKFYFRDMDQQEIVPPPKWDSRQISEKAWMYQIKQLSYSANDGTISEKLKSAAGAVHMCGGSLVMLIDRNRDDISLQIGAVDNVHMTHLTTIKDALVSSLTGNFPGAEFSPVSVEEVQLKLDETFMNSQHNTYVTAVSGRAMQSDDFKFYKGIDAFLNSSFQTPFTMMILADPVDRHQINKLRQIYDDLSTYLSQMMNASISEKDKAYIFGRLAAAVEMQRCAGKDLSEEKGGFRDYLSAGTSVANIIGSVMDSQHGKIITGEDIEPNALYQKLPSSSVKMINRWAKRLNEQIEKRIEWLNKIEDYGMYHISTYILSDNASTNMVVATTYKTLLNGEQTGKTYGVNTWRGDKAKKIKQYIGQFIHPRIIDPLLGILSPAVLISSKEMAHHLVMPKESIKGISVINYHTFGRNVISRSKFGSHGKTEIGTVSFLGKDMPGDKVSIDIDSMSGHTFVAGANRTGKSTAIFSLLHKVKDKGLPFLVIEPAKGEYKTVFAEDKDVAIYSPIVTDISGRVKPFCLDLFAFREGIDPNEHIEKLGEVFSASFPMYAAMPQVLKEALYLSYEDCGWDLETGSNPYGRIFPTIEEVGDNVKKVIEQSAFSGEVKGNYIGSLLTRIQSLDKGIYRRVFRGDLGDEQLFERNTIIDLSRPDAADFKSLIMGILIIRLFEYCTAKGEFPENSELKHLTVLEEAHTLLAPPRPSSEGANIGAKSVEMITRCIAELGGFGRGFLISDQSPGLLDRAVIRNTNTKMIFRLPDMDDCELCGKSMGLKPEQFYELSRLDRGVCAVYQINWTEAVLCHVKKEDYPLVYQATLRTEETVPDDRKVCITAFLEPYTAPGTKRSMTSEQREAALEAVTRLPIPGKVRLQMVKALRGEPDWKTCVLAAKALYPKGLPGHDEAQKDPTTAGLIEWTQEVQKGIDMKEETALTLIEALLDAERMGTKDNSFRDRWFRAIRGHKRS
jgi:hypothetical protein